VTNTQDEFGVSVRTAFLVHDSGTNPVSYHYAYEISQSMEKTGLPENSMILNRRYWKIDNLQGDVDEVDGPGVIGEYPILKPGVIHTYASR
jgi:F-box protein 3